MKTVEIIRAVATGQASAREVCEQALARIEAGDGRINAFTERTWRRARADGSCASPPPTSGCWASSWS